MTNEVKCEGACKNHIGEVLLVNVKGWGNFHYCEQAIRTDQTNGLVVSLVYPEIDDPWLSGDDIMGASD